MLNTDPLRSTIDSMRLGDKEIRSYLISSLRRKLNPASNIIIEEFDLAHGETRADVVVVNGKLTGIEIKSDLDTLNRLERQIGLYNQYFDAVEIYAVEKHIEKIKEIAPRWWGIKKIHLKDGEICVRVIRRGRRNANINFARIVSLLWKEEALNLLREHKQSKGFESKNRTLIWDRIVEKVSERSIKSFVLRALKSRQNWRSAPQQMSNDGLCRP